MELFIFLNFLLKKANLINFLIFIIKNLDFNLKEFNYYLFILIIIRIIKVIVLNLII